MIKDLLASLALILMGMFLGMALLIAYCQDNKLECVRMFWAP
jgi:hypothetical protein